ncbi:MAG: inorganic diphosphatase [Promethearchaeota archaeon]
MNLFKDLRPGPDPPKVVNVVVEIPTRSRNKYEYVVEGGYFFLDRVLPSPFGYPMDYGFVPRTLSEDGDALDALVLLHEPTFPGCVLEARVVGIARMRDEKGMDEKILTVAAREPRLNNVNSLGDLSEHWRLGITHFFEEYKRLEGPDKWAEVIDWRDVDAALEAVRAAIENYRKKLAE